MKKLFLLLNAFFAINIALIADSGFGACAIKLSVNEASDYSYVVYGHGNNWGEIDRDFSTNFAFNNRDFGNVTSLVINGGIAVGWLSGGDIFDLESFAIEYKMYPRDGSVPSTWESVPINTWIRDENTNKRFESSDKNVEIITQGLAGGIYVLEVRVKKTHHWSSGSYTIYTDNVNPGALVNKATFTIASEDPLVNLTVDPASAYIGETVTYSATTQNDDGLTLVYYVTTPTDPNPTVITGGTYQVTDEGEYIFKASLLDGGNAEVTSDTKTVTVTPVPDPINIKFKLPDGWTSARIWAWEKDGAGGETIFGVAGWDDRPPMTPVDRAEGWVEYTISAGFQNLTFIFTKDNLDDPRFETSTLVSESTCFVEGEPADCPDPTVGIEDLEGNTVIVKTEKGFVKAEFNGTFDVQLYNLSGIQIDAATATGEYTYTVDAGIYLLKIDGKVYKVLVK